MEAPWAARGRELEPTEGTGADFTAWEEWFRIESSKYEYLADFDIGFLERTELYAVMCDLVTQSKGGAK